MGLCALLTGSPKAEASVFVTYSSPTYICSTGIGCCTEASIDTLVQQMFEGTGLYSGQPLALQPYYKDTLWPKIETGLKKTADEIRNASAFYVAAIGTFIDGQTLGQAMRSVQKQTNDTMQNQSVSEQICRFGTMSRSLSNSQEKSRDVQQALITQMQDRELMKANTHAGTAIEANRMLGRSADKVERFAQFQTKFCDKTDSEQGLAKVCQITTDAQKNRDIDASRSLEVPLTLNIDFSGTSTAAKPTQDEENIFALASNLYAHDLFVNLGKSDFTTMATEGGDEVDGKIKKLIDFRSLIAKRSVAQNSFAALAGMKAAGSGASANYMKEIIKELGLSDARDLTAMLGDKPSYYAQMDVLTRKLYQSPKFYANLMESPTNVGRQQTAMEGVGLMQDRDIYESLRRSEMLMSSLLEIYVMREQDKFKDKETK